MADSVYVLLSSMIPNVVLPLRTKEITDKYNGSLLIRPSSVVV